MQPSLSSSARRISNNFQLTARLRRSDPEVAWINKHLTNTVDKTKRALPRPELRRIAYSFHFLSSYWTHLIRLEEGFKRVDGLTVKEKNNTFGSALSHPHFARISHLFICKHIHLLGFGSHTTEAKWSSVLPCSSGRRRPWISSFTVDRKQSNNNP